MATPFTIELVIDENGNVEAEAHGIDGPDCTDIMKFLDDLGEVKVDQKTSDWFKKGKQTVKTGR